VFRETLTRNPMSIIKKKGTIEKFENYIKQSTVEAFAFTSEQPSKRRVVELLGQDLASSKVTLVQLL
jgi:hypothetical protein